MIKLYVAGSWEDRRTVKTFMKNFKNLGFIITEDWTKHKDNWKSSDYCNADVKGIRDCSMLVLYNSGKETAGKYVELGLAYAYGKEIVSVGEKLTTVFKHLVNSHFSFTLVNERNILLACGVIKEYIDNLLGKEIE